MKHRSPVCAFLVAALVLWLCVPETHAQNIPDSKEATEVKFVVAEKDIDAMKALLHLDGGGSTGMLYFYDTPGGDLLAKQIILRSRIVERDSYGLRVDDNDPKNGTTVKLRSAGRIDRKAEAEWIDAIAAGDSDGGKIEFDQVIGKSAVESLSLDSPQTATAIRNAEKPGNAKLIFSALQRKCVDAHLPLDWNALRAIGPVKVTAWKKVKIAGIGKIDAEEWTLVKEGKPPLHLLEISKKVDGGAAQADAFEKQLAGYMQENGFSPGDDAETKTRAVFDYFK